MRGNEQVRAVILAGSYDFGRDPLARRLAPPLWPVGNRSVLERLLDDLAAQQVKNITVFSNIDYSSYDRLTHALGRSNVQFVLESLPYGTGGCIRESADVCSDDLLVIFSANIISPPAVAPLVSAHLEGQSDLTVFFDPASEDRTAPGEPAGIYVCTPKVLQYIPDKGYCDIKESLVPEMLRAGRNVHAVVLPSHTGSFTDWQGYRCAMADYLGRGPRLESDFGITNPRNVQDARISADATVDPSARFYGPVVIMNGAQVSENTIVVGPTVIGRQAAVGSGSVVAASVLWDRSMVGPNCEVHRCVVEHDASVPAGTVSQETVVTSRPKHMLADFVNSVSEFAVAAARSGRKSRGFRSLASDRLSPSHLLGLFAVAAAFWWCYRPGLMDLWNVWQRSDEYSSGLLVPFLAVYILWSRRHDLAHCPVKPCMWGIIVFLAAQALRLFGVLFMYGSAVRLSLVLSIWSLVLLLLGWRLFRRVFTVLLFLCLILPWPHRVQAAVTLPLQRWSTTSAVFCLETVGYDVIQEGNVIHIGQTSVAVAEACNGLRMVAAFVVISGLVVLLVNRAWWEKLIVLASSLPIALICNTLRLAVTAVFYTLLEGEQWQKAFHDFGGYAMMPLALAAVVGELWLMARLTTAPTKHQSLVVSRRRS